MVALDNDPGRCPDEQNAHPDEEELVIFGQRG
jgi:hypothetical protein